MGPAGTQDECGAGRAPRAGRSRADPHTCECPAVFFLVSLDVDAVFVKVYKYLRDHYENVASLFGLSSPFVN